MKQTIALTIGLLCALNTLGQLVKDSLWAVYRDPRAKPVERLHALVDLFGNNHISQLRPDSVAKYSSEMIALAKQVGDRDLEANGVRIFGNSYSARADYDRADSCFALADAMLGPGGDPLVRVKVLLSRGASLANRGLVRSALDKYAQGLPLADSLHDLRLIANLRSSMAGLYMQSGDIPKAIEYHSTALRMGEELQDSTMIGRALLDLGACNGQTGEVEKARQYFRQAAEVLERSGNQENLPRAYMNLGQTFQEGDPDSVLHYYNMGLAVAERNGDGAMLMGGYQAKSQFFIAYMQLPDSALVCLQKAMDAARSFKYPRAELKIKGSQARLEFDQGNTSKAIALAEEMLSGSRQQEDLAQQENAAKYLTHFYQHAGRYKEALEMFKLQVTLNDTLTSEENQREVIRQAFKYDYDKQALADSLNFAAETAIQQKEVQKQKLMRNGFMGGFALVALFAGVFFFQRNRISKEKARSEELLLNILPEEVAEELKAKGSAEAVHIDQVTVLFTDFKGFTAMSEMLSPQELVRDLNECFSAFDRITEKYGIEKIKTIGDAYMAAGGLPTPNTTHATDVINAAFEIRDFIAEGKARKIAAGLPFFEIRIGVHTGPVVAGIVGVKKFSYDIWGDTVNTASRMESSGEVGQVNISEATYALVKDASTPLGAPAFGFTPRGKVQAKGKGEMEMYFVELA